MKQSRQLPTGLAGVQIVVMVAAVVPGLCGHQLWTDPVCNDLLLDCDMTAGCTSPVLKHATKLYYTVLYCTTRHYAILYYTIVILSHNVCM